jgi:RimJ/RimL family protein N-acetyltransferase
MQLPIQWTTARLVLRKPERADAARIFAAYGQDPAVTMYLVWKPHTHVAETEAYIEHCLTGWQSGRDYTYAILDQATADLIGMIRVQLSGWQASLGYVLARHAWGQGIMPEAAQAITALVLHQPAMFRVWAVCDVDNAASARVLEKIGMHREGLMRRGVVHPNISDEPRDCWLYAKTKEDVRPGTALAHAKP